MDLDVFDGVGRDGGFPRGVSWFFDHAETVSEESLHRIAALGGGLSVQNRLMFQGQAFLERYGPEPTATAPPIKKMLERGLTVAAGTDATRLSSYIPWLSIEWFVRGRDIGGTLLSLAQNRVDRETALRMYTVNGAALTGESDEKGLLKVGYLADFAVLSDDYFSVPDDQISRIESVLTAVGGKIVYAAGPFEGQEGPQPESSVPCSPVEAFGGYYGGTNTKSLYQADAVAEVAAASDEHFAWRVQRGRVSPQLSHGASPLEDPCFE
jgi:predicted amidohydrolase YtcJ